MGRLGHGREKRVFGWTIRWGEMEDPREGECPWGSQQPG